MAAARPTAAMFQSHAGSIEAVGVGTGVGVGVYVFQSHAGSIETVINN